ncbi:MAG: TatD family hydrolase [Planctomycetota bacterium]
MTPQYIDSHAHLYFDRFDADRDAVIARARSAGFVAIINISTNSETCRAALDLARAHPGFCYASAGLHPTSSEITDAELDRTLAEFAELIDRHPDEIRAVGEIGLDYYWDTATPARQAIAFKRQLALAIEKQLPVVIHCRDAWDDTLALVAEHATGTTGVFHCFGGTVEQAERALALGWHVSFAGNVSYPKATALRDAALRVPLDRLLLETDAPFMAPQPLRGKRNEPAHALHTARTLAELHQTTTEEIGRHTTANARRLFRLP